MSDWGNPILDIFNLRVVDALSLEKALSEIPGVVGHGLFASCLPDIIIEAGKQGVVTHLRDA